MRVRFPITNYLITINPDHVIAYPRLLDVARLAADNGDHNESESIGVRYYCIYVCAYVYLAIYKHLLIKSFSACLGMRLSIMYI